MRIRAVKWLAAAVCSLSLSLVSATPSEACWGLFGCGRGCGYGYGSFYGPVYSPMSYGGCGSGGCGVSSYYAPVGCGSCGSCGPCGSVCGSSCGSVCGSSCTGGNCSLGSDGNLSPMPDSGSSATPWQPKKKTPDSTYESNSGATGSEGTEGTGTSIRTSPKSGLGNDSGGSLGEEERFSKPTRANKPEAGEAKGESEGASGEESTPVNPKGTGTKNTPKLPKAPLGDDGAGAQELPKLNLDEKIAWRPAAERKRLEPKSNVANARLVRLPAYPKSDWLPVEPESKLAKK